ncbi:putative 3-phenylpropionic acid transporter [uncultured Roseburia sp.]|uniref:MFS transporter n=1 Tax=Brotonthovivens ammoniilytica TaxID=2981725 RepID=A0ABT2TLC8_9FIRM|nr:MFS transporter [Brotonthovivens ammoniilytica]MCU6762344.1 MFS transporter [Brotonthovivens ammoniilytica]SCI68677.1 putative 3-phenylpropionic acid transporter [uncultured Roseburia sp.]
MKTHQSSIQARYAMIHGGYQAAYSIVVGYASVYLLAQGFDNAVIGIILSVANGAAAILQPFLGSYLDRSQKITVQFFGCILLVILMLLSGILIFTPVSNLPLAVIMVLILTLQFSLQPLINSLCFLLEHTGISINFGLSRGVGSVSYAVASVIIGKLVAVYHESLLPVFYLAFFAGLTCFFWSLRKVPSGSISQTADDSSKLPADGQALSLPRFIITYKRFILFLVGSMLVYFMFFITGNFFTIQIVSAIGGGTSEMGIAVAICAAVELPVMANFNRLNRKIPAYWLLRISVIFFLLKFLFTLLAKSVPAFYAAQLFQMGSYALYYPGAAAYINRLLPKADLVKGQSLLTTMFTISGIFGSFFGGLLLNHTSAFIMLLVSFFIALAGAVITWFSLEKIQ